MTKHVHPAAPVETPGTESHAAAHVTQAECHQQEGESGTRPVSADGPFVTVEEVFENDGLTRRGWVGWWSHQPPRGMAYGQSVKDDTGRSRCFPSADAARTAAEQEGELQMDRRKPFRA
ncbi:MAG: hypothetical protein JWN04_4056 [Myxococcaceae bacterium]|nr:hypothetical protein [Myxococcaceae bacterium]